MRVAILGAGITGLSASHFLKEVTGVSSVALFEATSQPGGWVRTTPLASSVDASRRYLFEQGPRGFRPSGLGRETLHLVERLGLQDQVLPSNAAAKARFICVDGQLERVPDSLIKIFQSPITRPLVYSLLREVTVPKTKEADVSVGSFFRRRFGQHAVDYLVDPVMSGIYAGDINKLSMKACLSSVWELEQRFGSVAGGVLGLLGSKLIGRKAISNKMLESAQNLYLGEAIFEKTRGAALVSFTQGMQSLTDALANDLSTSLRLNHTVTGLDFRAPTGCNVVFTDASGRESSEHFDHVISALQAKPLSKVLRRSSHAGDVTPLVDQLHDFGAGSLVVVNVAFPSQCLPKELHGFGYLVPSREKEKILGVVFDSLTFPEQQSAREVDGQICGELRLTVMMGGAHHPDLIHEPDATIQDIVQSALLRHLKIEAQPDVTSICRVIDGIYQPTVGFSLRTEQFEHSVARQFGNRFRVLGSSFYGVAINECVATARQFAQHQFLEWAATTGGTCPS